MPYRKDFLKILEKYEQLPHPSLKYQLNQMKELKEHKIKIVESTKKLNMQKEWIAQLQTEKD